MAALTSDTVKVCDVYPEPAPNQATVQLASTTIYQGAFSMLVAGKARPYVSGTAGSTILGIAQANYTSAGTDKTYTDDSQMVFRRGVYNFDGKAGDLPTQAKIGVAGGVAFEDTGTVKNTAAANDLTGTLRAIKQGQYWVEF